jgi:tRNA nucleotidyltransferase (CCA-adding enzyme)
MKLVGDLASARLRDELLDLLEEPNVAQAVQRMGDIGVDRALHPHLLADGRALELIARADRALAAGPFAAEARPALARLACLCAAMPSHEIYEWLGRIRMRRREQDIVAESVTVGPLVAARLAEQPDPSELYELLDGRSAEVLVAAIAFSADPGRSQQLLLAYLERIRGVGLAITGDDLKRRGVPESPELGQALRTTLALKLDGFVAGREQELETALRLLGRAEGEER